MADLFEKGLYMGLGILTVTKEKAEKLIQDLVDKGKLTQDESAKAIKDLLAKAEEEKKAFGQKVDTALEGAVRKLNLVTQKDIQEINKKLDKILKNLKVQE
jgi:polyhydroxyalkanoate synthesis regulator phasin